ncbi:hypothetical protein [Microbacterium sp.]|uniref:hypothetical protein n=1 Tax=Microbacterium sp. TaxID=51671 RepID=UPI003A8FB752
MAVKPRQELPRANDRAAFNMLKTLGVGLVLPILLPLAWGVPDTRWLGFAAAAVVVVTIVVLVTRRGGWLSREGYGGSPLSTIIAYVALAGYLLVSVILPPLTGWLGGLVVAASLLLCVTLLFWRALREERSLLTILAGLAPLLCGIAAVLAEVPWLHVGRSYMDSFADSVEIGTWIMLIAFAGQLAGVAIILIGAAILTGAEVLLGVAVVVVGGAVLLFGLGGLAAGVTPFTMPITYAGVLFGVGLLLFGHSFLLSIAHDRPRMGADFWLSTMVFVMVGGYLLASNETLLGVGAEVVGVAVILFGFPKLPRSVSIALGGVSVLLFGVAILGEDEDVVTGTTTLLVGISFLLVGVAGTVETFGLRPRIIRLWQYLSTRRDSPPA